MNTIINRIHITLFFLAAFAAKPAHGEINKTNDAESGIINASAFYSEWTISPSNALEQITPPLMELALSAKTNAAAQTALQRSLWHLFSTNTVVKDDYWLRSKKNELIAGAFAASGIYSTPQEKKVLSLAKALAFIRNTSTPDLPFPMEFLDQSAYDAMARKLVENGASKTSGPRIIFNEFVPRNSKLAQPRHTDPEEAWECHARFKNLQHELDRAGKLLFDDLSLAAWSTASLPQETRDNLFAEIVSLEMLTDKEKDKIESRLLRDPWER